MKYRDWTWGRYSSSPLLSNPHSSKFVTPANSFKIERNDSNKSNIDKVSSEDEKEEVKASSAENMDVFAQNCLSTISENNQDSESGKILLNKPFWVKIIFIF